MFYYITPSGFPIAFESFEAYYQDIRKHAVKVNETTVHTVAVPQREDFHCSDYKEGFGFDGRALKVWTKGGKLIGYEF